MYIPPFTITEKILHLIAGISEQVGSQNARIGSDVPSPMLRKKNQIKTIHSSLAIENNTLSLKQVTGIIDGKHVLGAPDEILEVKNAIEAYRLMKDLDAFKEKDLLCAHELMMKDLVRYAGHYRQEGVGVFDCWKGLLAWISVETIVREHQQEYYSVIAKCDAAGESTLFVEFMLQCLLDAIENYEETEEDDANRLHDKLHDKFPELSDKAIEVLEVIHVHPSFNAAEIGEQVGLSERQVKTYITKLKQIGLLVRVGSNKTGYWKVNIE